MIAFHPTKEEKHYRRRRAPHRRNQRQLRRRPVCGADAGVRGGGV